MLPPRKFLVMLVLGLVFGSVGSATAAPSGELRKGGLAAPSSIHASFPEVLDNFQVVGHESFGKVDTNADVWFHNDTAYVGTSVRPCTGLGVKVVDVSVPSDPVLLNRVGARTGTSAEDVVVRSISTPSFTGDLLAVGIRRCGTAHALDSQSFGVEFWKVTDPSAPTKLSAFGVRTGFGGVNELDLFQRDGKAYALLASPNREWSGAHRGDIVIVDVTDPSNPTRVGQWGARIDGLSKGLYQGLGSLATRFGHSVRASADGTKAYVSYWDLGVVTLDITDPTDPERIGRTHYDRFADGDAHSMVEHVAAGTNLILQNDEDFDPRSPVRVVIGRGPASGVGSESPYGKALWSMPDHRVAGRVYRPRNQGCALGDYPNSARVVGRIVVVKTYMTFFDPAPHPVRQCTQTRQARLAIHFGAKAVLHDVISKTMSPQWWDHRAGSFAKPVVFTPHRVALRILDRGRTRLQATRPSWGFLRVFDASTGRQVARFDNMPRVNTLQTAGGTWSIHNTEINGNRAYSSWYSGGVVALNLDPLDTLHHGNPIRVGRFVPDVGASQTNVLPDGLPLVWGVAVDPVTGYLYVSDMTSGLWIVDPIGAADPT